MLVYILVPLKTELLPLPGHIRSEYDKISALENSFNSTIAGYFRNEDKATVQKNSSELFFCELQKVSDLHFNIRPY